MREVSRSRLVCLILVAVLGAVIACGGDDDDTTPTPETFEVAEGVFAHTESPPALPPGSVALSEYFVFESEDDASVVAGIPLNTPQESTLNIGFYSYVSGAWGGTIGAISLEQGGAVLQGVFPSVPANVIALQISGTTPPPVRN